MIYIVHGENLSNSRTQILNLQKKLNTLAKTEILLGDITPEHLLEMLSAFDIFGEAPFVVVDISTTHFSKYEGFAKLLAKAPHQSTLVILANKELSKTNAFLKNKTAETRIILSAPAVSTNVFKFVDLLFYKNREEAYKELTKLLIVGEDPFYLFSMIMYGLRNVAHAKFNSPSFAKVAPFLKGKAVSQAKHFSEEKLTTGFSQLYHLDKAVKTGVLSPELLLPVTIEKILKTSNT